MQAKWIPAAIGLSLLSACDYSVPLAKTPDRPIDPAVIGAWSQTDENGKTERLLVLPLHPNEYLVSYPAGGPNAMFARGCLCRANDRTLVQLTWFGTADGTVPDTDNERLYQYVAYTVKEDRLEVSLLNADVVKRDVKTAEALLQSLAANKDNPELFRDALVFHKDKRPDDANAKRTRPPIPAAWR